jgi:hypothetical protein
MSGWGAQHAGGTQRQKIAPMSGGETGEKQHGGGGDIETGESTNKGQQSDRHSNMLGGL